jgi:hypothetical protein
MGRPKGSKNKPRGVAPEVNSKAAQKPRSAKVAKPKVTSESKKPGYRVLYNVGEYSYPYEVMVSGVNTEIEAEAYFKKYFPTGEVVKIAECKGM